MFLESFLTVIGLYCLTFYLYDILKAPIIMVLYFLRMCIGLNDFNIKEKYGDWAAITGASDGIGKEYARELAARGINVVLISRSLEKLDLVAKDIEREFYVKTKVIVADFSEGKSACRLVEKQLDSIPVRILINNVGQTTTDPGPLAAFTDDELWSVILTNIGVVTQLSRYFIKRFHRSQDSAIIVNVSSATGNFPVQNNAIYAATKAYTTSLTLALHEEARTSGVDVQLLAPHFVSTKFIDYCNVIKYSDLLLPDATTFAQAAVNRLGKVEETTGYYRHDFEYALLRACPRRLAHFLSFLFSKLVILSVENRKI